eukprot:scaffold36280_cov12-Tisochrysis_lutea.AAC.1
MLPDQAVVGVLLQVLGGASQLADLQTQAGWLVGFAQGRGGVEAPAAALLVHAAALAGAAACAVPAALAGAAARAVPAALAHAAA